MQQSEVQWIIPWIKALVQALQIWECRLMLVRRLQ
jgi:hypothetical protein